MYTYYIEKGALMGICIISRSIMSSLIYIGNQTCHLSKTKQEKRTKVLEQSHKNIWMRSKCICNHQSAINCTCALVHVSACEREKRKPMIQSESRLTHDWYQRYYLYIWSQGLVITEDRRENEKKERKRRSNKISESKRIHRFKEYIARLANPKYPRP